MIIEHSRSLICVARKERSVLRDRIPDFFAYGVAVGGVMTIPDYPGFRHAGVHPGYGFAGMTEL